MANTAPLLTNISSPYVYAENTVNSAPQQIDTLVSFTDPDNNFNGGTLKVSGLLAEDSVAVRNQGTAAGEIGVSGSNVTFGGLVIGTFAGGNGTPLTVDFNASATAEAIEALIENLTYANSSNTPTESRTLSILVTDNAGLTTATAALPAFAERTGTDSPFTGISVFAGDSAPSLADVDSDGDLDLVLGGYDGTLSYYKNTGTATAPVYAGQTGAANPFDGINVGRYATSSLGDVDGDGDLDLVVGQEDGGLFYYKNTGTATAPVFTEQTGAANPFNGFSVGGDSAPSLADVNGDGKIDLVLGESGGTLLYYQNTGTATVPAFTLQTGAANPFNGIDIGLDSAPSLGDVDGDGDLDLVAGQYDGNLFYYKNTGTTTAPVFTEQTGAANPFTGVDVGDPAGLSTPSLGDVDGDGDLDLVSGEYDGVLNYFENTSGTRVQIIVTPENDAPTLNQNTGLTLAEGGSSVILASKLGYSDAEQTDSQLVYTITSQTAGTVVKSNVMLAVGQTFTQLDIDSGLIEFHHDGSEGASAGFAFSLSDGTATINSSFDITVTPVNDAPTAVSFTNAVAAVAENTLTQVKVADIVIADVDGGTNTLSLSGADANAFEIIGNALFLKTGTALDFESKKTYAVTVNVDDATVGAAPDAFANFTVSVTDVNEAPTALAFSNVLASIAENASTAARRKIADFTVTDDALGTETITLSGTDASKFEIFDGDLYLKAGATLDFETNPKLDVTVNVDDTTLGSGIELSRSLSVNVTDVLETISGSSGSNTLTGTSGADRINAGAGNDTVNGGAGDDIIYGGAGVDRLTGGTGRDTFVFKSITESGYRASGSLTEGGPLTDQAAIRQRDIITDFTPGFDKIDLSDIDANTSLSGNQAFTFRGTGGLSSAGSLVYRKFDNAGTANDRTIIFADVTGDGRSDFQIELTGLKTLGAGDFVL